MESVAFALLSLQGVAQEERSEQTLRSSLEPVFEGQPERRVLNSRLLLNWIKERVTTDDESAECRISASLAAWPAHRNPVLATQACLDAIGQGFDIHIEVYSPDCHTVLLALFFQMHCGPTVGANSRRLVTKKQKNAISEVLGWASVDWRALEGLSEPRDGVLRCQSQPKEALSTAHVSLHAVYDKIRRATRERLEMQESGGTCRVIGASALERNCSRRTSFSPSPAAPRCKDFLMRLPMELSALVLVHLDPRSLHALSCCSKAIRRDCDGIIPGLQLRLYPHQYNSVWWMLDRERPGQKEVSVVYQSFYGPPGTISLGEDHEESAGPARQECNSRKSYVCSEAFSTSWLGYSGFYAVNPRGGINSSHDPDCPLFYVNLLSGDISHAVFSVSGNTIEAPDEVLSRRPRGGMLCDEPGLGKSVTMLAVILRSLGTVATPPVQGGTAATITGPPGSPMGRPSSRSKRRRSGGEPPSEFVDSSYATTAVASTDSPTMVPDDTVQQKSDRIHVTNGLFCSGATLIVVPETLLDHWRLQADMHIAQGVACKVFVDEAAFVNSNRFLPSAEYLSSMHIVIVGHRRLGLEWKRTFPTTELEDTIAQRSAVLSGLGRQQGKRSYATESGGADISPLHRIHWLRLAVDEGHTIGKGQNSSNASLMASSLSAERKWVLTGTPTPTGQQVAASTQLRYLLQIFKFLGCEPFSLPTGDKSWKALIQVPFEMCSRVVEEPAADDYSEAATTADSEETDGQTDVEQCAVSRPSSTVGRPLHDRKVLGQWRWALDKATVRLQSILSEVMVRHVKADVAAIPMPIYHQSRLTMSDQERSSYNAMVALVQSNVVTTEHDYVKKNGTHQDSLLNPKNKKYLADMMMNIRIAACGGGTARLTVPSVQARMSVCLGHLARFAAREKSEGSQTTIASTSTVNVEIGDNTVKENKGCEETSSGRVNTTAEGISLAVADMAQTAQDKAAAQVEKFRSYVYRTLSGDTKMKCECCGMDLILLLVTPCVHLYCTDCVDRMGDFCELCSKHFNWNDFQVLQPGFEASQYVYENKPDVLDSTGRGIDAPIDASHSSSSISTSIGDNAAHVFTDGSISNGQLLPDAISSKARYLIDKIHELEGRHLRGLREAEENRDLDGYGWLPLSAMGSGQAAADSQNDGIIPKVIVFSQYLVFLDQIVIDLRTAGVSFSFFHGKQKTAALRRFRYCPDVRVLVLPREGSHGLDLSFVTHIFLMDTVFDESLEQQVISRAYRMGTKRSVVVDQLIMLDTIEENIYRQRHNVKDPKPDSSSTGNVSIGNGVLDNRPAKSVADKQFGRLQRLVASLRLVRTDEERVQYAEAHGKSAKTHPHGFWFDVSKSSRCHT